MLKRVQVSCYGDLHLDISLDEDVVDIKNIKHNNLIDYMFSYLDKNVNLKNEFDVELIEDATKNLFADEIDLTSYINNYVYGNYSYTIKDGVVKREKTTCSSDVEYVSQLYGHSFNDKMLSVDINIGYLKDGMLYNLSDEKLGKYDGNIKLLGDLFRTSSYYRFNYVLDDDNYKLKSVEWNIRY